MPPYDKLQTHLERELALIREAGLYKDERVLTSPQGLEVEVAAADGSRRRVLNFCANNYLGLANHPAVVAAAHAALDRWGYGLASVRFICGTQELHKELELKVAAFLGMDEAILFAACFDANGGVFESLLGENDAIVADALNHASIIDGVRLCKAQRFIYNHADLGDLEAKLKEAARARFRLIATDGVFSMDGDVAPLAGIVALARKYDALVMVDDSHATGFVGRTGRGTAEACGVLGDVDIITTTFGKALGGASGGCIAGRKAIVDWYRQKARPYLFSNTLAPAVAGATLAALDLLTESTALRDKLEANTTWFREAMTAAGFDLKSGNHPIVPIMLYNAKLAQDMARDLLAAGIYVIGFSYPVVPKGQARIRVQVSAAHDREQLERAAAAFAAVGAKYGILGKTKADILSYYGF